MAPRRARARARRPRPDPRGELPAGRLGVRTSERQHAGPRFGERDPRGRRCAEEARLRRAVRRCGRPVDERRDRTRDVSVFRVRPRGVRGKRGDRHGRGRCEGFCRDARCAPAAWRRRFRAARGKSAPRHPAHAEFLSRSRQDRARERSCLRPRRSRLEGGPGHGVLDERRRQQDQVRHDASHRCARRDLVPRLRMHGGDSAVRLRSGSHGLAARSRNRHAGKHVHVRPNPAR
jgi:hypothetical protein